MPRRRAVTVATILGMTVAACSSDGDDTPTTTEMVTTTTAPQSVETDGQLIIGVMIPPDDSLLAQPIEGAVQSAQQRINAAGGVLGRDVVLVVVAEGDTAAEAATAVQELIDADVDAIVGPSSSLVALGVLDDIVSAGVVSCSPTASSMALDDFPDEGLFFRTVPSDSLQAQAIADAADETGAGGATIVYADDAYGRAFADAVTDALQLQPGAMSVVESIPFRADDDLDDAVARLIATNAQVAIVLADADDGTSFLTALDEADTEDLAAVFVNDAMRDPTSPQRLQELSAEFREKIVGLAPQAESSDPSAPFDPPGLFAANAYDCVNLIALAAVTADSDAPSDIAAQIPPVSSNGSRCRTFADCAAAIADGLQVNYDGPTSLTEIQVGQGDPARANFDQFIFDETGTDVFLRLDVAGF